MGSNIFKTKTAGLMIASVVIGLVLWLVLLRPEIRRLHQAVADLAEAQNEITARQNKKKFVSEAEAQFVTIQQDLVKLADAIPDESQSGILVSEIQTLAQNNGVSIESIATENKAKVVPKKTNTTSASKNSDTAGDSQSNSSKSKSTYAEGLLAKYNGLVVSVRIRSSYDGLRQFLSGLTALDRLAAVDSLNVTQDQQDTNMLESNITFYSYWRGSK